VTGSEDSGRFWTRPPAPPATSGVGAANGYAAMRRLVEPVMRTVYRLQVRGVEHVPDTGSLVVVANHTSMLDPFVLGAAVPRDLRYLAKAELWSVPLLPLVLDGLGGIPVARGRGDRTAVAAAVTVLEAGGAVALFPEGGVRRAGPWLRGAARMALLTGAPVLPVRLVDVDRALGPGTVGLPRLAVLIGEPLRVVRSRPTIASARELTARMQHAVAELGS
jgi:1-acyl-sn-glycerol-3-phosphate acyltransferase